MGEKVQWFIETYENSHGNTVLWGRTVQIQKVIVQQFVTNSNVTEGDCVTISNVTICYTFCDAPIVKSNFHNRCIPNMQRSTDPTLCNNYLLDTQLDTKTKCKMNGKNSNQGPKKNAHRPLESLEKYCWRPLKILEWNLALWKRNTKNLCTVCTCRSKIQEM